MSDTDVLSEFEDLLRGVIFATDSEYRLTVCAGHLPHGAAVSTSRGDTLEQLLDEVTGGGVGASIAEQLRRREEVIALPCGRPGEVSCVLTARPVFGGSGFTGIRGAIRAGVAARASMERVPQALLAGINHELRTPLNAIIGFSEILRAELLGPMGDERYRGYAEDILLSGRQLLHVVDGILDMSRVDDQPPALRESVVDVEATARSCLRVISDRLAEKGVVATVLVADGAGQVMADDHALRQMLLHLLANAEKFVGNGGKVDIIAEVMSDGALSLTVADDGEGIDSDQMQCVLVPFIRPNYLVSPAEMGSGLGLPITRALVELHGGALHIRSRPGAGTAVSLVFPASRRVAGGEGEGRQSA